MIHVTMVSLFSDLGWALAAVALGGAGYALLSAVLVTRFMRGEQKAPEHAPAVSILKPLYQVEPDLFQNLETFFAQDYPGELQIVFGVHDESDPAVQVVRALQAKYPHSDTAIVADTALYGANAKVSNLINMLPSAKHDTLVLSDADIAVGTGWLSQVTAALARPGLGFRAAVVQASDGLAPYDFTLFEVPLAAASGVEMEKTAVMTHTERRDVPPGGDLVF